MELSLKDMRKRGRERRADESDLQKELAKIEKNAMKDYMAQDVERMPPVRTAVPAERAARLAELEAQISTDRLARAAAATTGGRSLPAGWRAATNPDGRVYYVHDASGAMQWEAPGGAATGAVQDAASSRAPMGAATGAASAAASAGWQQGYTAEGVAYYYHVGRGVTQWEPPEGWAGTTGSATAGMAESSAAGEVAAAAAAGVGTLAVAQAASGVDNVAAGDQGGGGDGEGGGGDGDEGRGAGDDEGRHVGGHGDEEEPGVDASTGLGAWTVVEQPVMPAGGWEYERKGDKRQKVAWAVTRAEDEDEEEAAALEDLQERFPVPKEMEEAAQRAAREQAAAAEAAEANAPAAVFAKRKGNKAGIRKKA